MNKILLGAGALFLFVAGIFPSIARAVINYGSGYYTNLCGTGTQASAYTCGSGCSPATGTCSSTNDGAVRYLCSGKLTQCMENETGWANGMSLGNPGCGYTVQLSIYDQKCRTEDGGWNNSCQQLGYMVWYSGDCRPGVAGYATAFSASPSAVLTPTGTTPRVSRVPTPTNKLTPTVTIKPTMLPTVTITKTPTITSKVVSATSSAIQSPDTGAPIWLLGIGVAILLYVGIKILHIGKTLWD